MNQEEFIKACASRGYCTRKEAKKYVKNSKKDIFTDEDFEEIYRIQEKKYLVEHYYEHHIDNSKGDTND